MASSATSSLLTALLFIYLLKQIGKNKSIERPSGMVRRCWTNSLTLGNILNLSMILLFIHHASWAWLTPMLLRLANKIAFWSLASAQFVMFGLIGGAFGKK